MHAVILGTQAAASKNMLFACRNRIFSNVSLPPVSIVRLPKDKTPAPSVFLRFPARDVLETSVYSVRFF